MQTFSKEALKLQSEVPKSPKSDLSHKFFLPLHLQLLFFFFNE